MLTLGLPGKPQGWNTAGKGGREAAVATAAAVRLKKAAGVHLPLPFKKIITSYLGISSSLRN